MLFRKPAWPGLALLLAAGAASAREISMLSGEWAPHHGSELPGRGLTTTRIKAAFAAGGHRAEADFISWARALEQVDEGRADIVMGACHDREREQACVFSGAIYFLEPGLIARAGHKLAKFDSLRDHEPCRIGVSRGLANSEEFDAADYLARHAGDIGHGDLKQNIAPDSRAEIGRLAEAIHRMQTSLRVAVKRIYARSRAS